MEALLAILLLAVFVEKIVEYIQGHINWKDLSALVLGVIVAFGFEVDIFLVLGLVAEWSWLGYVMSGLALGAGSAFVHDLIEQARS